MFFLPCACRFALVGFLSSLLASGLKPRTFHFRARRSFTLSSKLSPSKPQALEGSASRRFWYRARGDSGPLPEPRQMSRCEMNSRVVENELSFSGLLFACLNDLFVTNRLFTPQITLCGEPLCFLLYASLSP